MYGVTAAGALWTEEILWELIGPLIRLWKKEKLSSHLND